MENALKMIGFISIVLGVLVGAILIAEMPTAWTIPYAVAVTVSGILTGILFLAFSEVITLLKKIALGINDVSESIEQLDSLVASHTINCSSCGQPNQVPEGKRMFYCSKCGEGNVINEDGSILKLG